MWCAHSESLKQQTLILVMAWDAYSHSLMFERNTMRETERERRKQIESERERQTEREKQRELGESHRLPWRPSSPSVFITKHSDEIRKNRSSWIKGWWNTHKVGYYGYYGLSHTVGARSWSKQMKVANSSEFSHGRELWQVENSLCLFLPHPWVGPHAPPPAPIQRAMRM